MREGNGLKKKTSLLISGVETVNRASLNTWTTDPPQSGKTMDSSHNTITVVHYRHIPYLFLLP